MDPGLSDPRGLWCKESAQMPQCRGEPVGGSRFSGCPPELHLFSEPWPRPRSPPNPWGFQPFSGGAVLSWIPQLDLPGSGWVGCPLPGPGETLGGRVPRAGRLDLPPKSSMGPPGSSGGWRGWLGHRPRPLPALDASWTWLVRGAESQRAWLCRPSVTA